MLISNFAERLNEALKIKNITSAEIVRQSEKLYELKKINKPLNKPLMSNYLKGIYEAKQDNIYALSIILDCDESWLMGYDVAMQKKDKSNNPILIPVVGYIKAGVPIEAIEAIEYQEIDEKLAKTGKFIAFKVKGNSMFPYILEDDTLIVKIQNTCADKEIALVLNGHEAMVRKVLKNKNGITLVAFNSIEFEPTPYTNKEIEELPVTIVGVYEELRRKKLKK